MDGERDHLPGEHRLSELAHLFNPEQAFLFHHLSDCFFRKARLPRYPIVQVTPGNGRRVSRKGGSPDVFLYAFDVLELDGRDLRAQSWDARRTLLTQLLDRCQDGLRLSEHIADTDGAVVFRQACVMGLEGIVAKRRDSRYRSGRRREWIKVKNRAHPAFERAMLIALSKRTGSGSR
jgi:ATP-dependent DNA ligase